MQIIKREELPEQRQVRLTIAVDKDTWQASLAKCYQGVKSVCPVAGEPTRENLEQAYGPEFLYQEAVNDTYPQALVEAISQSDIQIAGTPTLSVETIGPDGYTFAAVIDLYPEVELGQYKGLSAVYPQVELSNDDTEAALDEYARANPDVQHPERAAMGDEVTLDFEGFVDGVPFEGGKGEQYPLLLGSGYFIPGFEEQVAGAAVGEERDVKVTFPTEYVPELAGKDAVFHIKVHQITRRAMPEWDDDFARQQGFADVSALRRAVMETAVQKKQAQAAEQFANDLIRQVTEAMTVTIPAAMVENQLDGLINELRGHLQAQGVSLEQYLEMGNTTMEQLRDHAREQAAAAARYELAMTEIAHREGIDISEADVDARLDEMLELASQGAQVLHNRSVELAKKYQVNLEVLSSFERKPGTKVKEVAKQMEKTQISGVAKDKNVARLALVGVEDRPGIAYKVFSLLGQQNINVDIILQSIGRDESQDISFTVRRSDVDQAVALLEAHKSSLAFDHIDVDKSVVKVSIVGAGMVDNAGVAAKMFGALYDADINIHMISTSEIKVSVLLDEADANMAVQAIHDKFFGE